ncbi:MAG: TlyA family RNA methyltransferase [Coriobacteriia bacterium]|nr:TlyA family RNA methyltransferase [Coriobacteriia bacterium]
MQRPGKKIRLDALLVQRGFYDSCDSAARSIYAGQVTSPRLINLKPGTMVTEHEELVVKKTGEFVSRGGVKLAAALDSFVIDVDGLHCVDIGTGSGGFTDCLLQRGATSVTAIDVGYGQFDWRLRQNQRVTLLERTNFTKLPAPAPDQAFDLAVVDLSFTKTSRLLSAIRNFIKLSGQAVILIKPQFELTEQQTQSSGFQAGVVTDPTLHTDVLNNFTDQATTAMLVTQGLIPSPIKGADGNREFLFWATRQGIPANIDIQTVVDLAAAT